MNSWNACTRLSNKMQLISFVFQLLLKACLTSRKQFSLCTGKSTNAHGKVVLREFEAEPCVSSVTQQWHATMNSSPPSG